MLSYIILHYNRPYFLDLHIKLIRTYLPDIHIIVADDGSYPDVVKSIERMDIDCLHTNPDKSKYRASDTIMCARKLIKYDFCGFSEDDFLFCPGSININAKGFPDDSDVMPLLFFPKKTSVSLFKDAVQLLKTFPEVKHIQLARDSVYNKRTKLLKTPISVGNTDWFFVDHKHCPVYYYCNWPYIMRTSDIINIPLTPHHDIVQIEKQQERQFNNVFGKTKNWAVCPKPPMYMHVGRGVSIRAGVKKKNIRSIINFRTQQKGVGKIIDKEPINFSNKLAKWYAEGKFEICFDELFEFGLNDSFLRALNKLGGKI